MIESGLFVEVGYDGIGKYLLAVLEFYADSSVIFYKDACHILSQTNLATQCFELLRQRIGKAPDTTLNPLHQAFRALLCHGVNQTQAGSGRVGTLVGSLHCGECHTGTQFFVSHRVWEETVDNIHG